MFKCIFFGALSQFICTLLKSSSDVWSVLLILQINRQNYLSNKAKFSVLSAKFRVNAVICIYVNAGGRFFL